VFFGNPGFTNVPAVHNDVSVGQRLRDRAQAQRKPKRQSDGMTDHFRWEAVAIIAKLTGIVHPSRMPASGHPDGADMTRPSLPLIH
jgi:hypothetical protein